MPYVPGYEDDAPTPVLNPNGTVTVIVPEAGKIKNTQGTVIGTIPGFDAQGHASGGSSSPPPTPAPVIPPEATVTERDAQGKPTAYTVPGDKQNMDLPHEQGQELTKHYTKVSTPGKAGILDTNEDTVNRTRALGVNPGADIPEGTVLLVDDKGKPYRRETAADIDRAEPNSTLQESLRSGKYVIPVKTYDGKEAYLTPKEADNYKDLSDRDAFELFKDKGVIPKASEFVPKEDTADKSTWAYQAAGTYQANRGNIKLNNGGYMSRDAYNAMTPDNRRYIMANGVDAFNESQSKIKATQDAAIITLSGYKNSDTGGYDLASALVSDDPKVKGAIPVVFKPEDVKDTQAWIDKNWGLGDGNGFQRSVNRVWQWATPWKEEKGETAISYASNVAATVSKQAATDVKALVPYLAAVTFHGKDIGKEWADTVDTALTKQEQAQLSKEWANTQAQWGLVGAKVLPTVTGVINAAVKEISRTDPKLGKEYRASASSVRQGINTNVANIQTHLANIGGMIKSSMPTSQLHDIQSSLAALKTEWDNHPGRLSASDVKDIQGKINDLNKAVDEGRPQISPEDLDKIKTQIKAVNDEWLGVGDNLDKLTENAPESSKNFIQKLIDGAETLPHPVGWNPAITTESTGTTLGATMSLKMVGTFQGVPGAAVAAAFALLSIGVFAATRPQDTKAVASEIANAFKAKNGRDIKASDLKDIVAVTNTGKVIPLNRVTPFTFSPSKKAGENIFQEPYVQQNAKENILQEPYVQQKAGDSIYQEPYMQQGAKDNILQEPFIQQKAGDNILQEPYIQQDAKAGIFLITETRTQVGTEAGNRLIRDALDFVDAGGRARAAVREHHAPAPYVRREVAQRHRTRISDSGEAILDPEYQKYADTQEAGKAVVSRAHTYEAELARKRAILKAAWSSYVASLNPSPMLGGKVSPLQASAVAYYTLPQQMAAAGISAQTISEVQSAVAPLVSVSVSTSAKTSTQTQPLTQSAVKAASQSATQSATRSATKEAARAETRTAAESLTRTNTNVQSKPIELTKANTAELTEIMEAEWLKQPGGGDNKKNAGIKYKPEDGAIAWRQGVLNGKDIIYVLTRPYRSQKDLRKFIGEVPAGAALATGEGSAQRSARLIKGKGPKNVRIDLGMQDLRITSEGKRVFLDFTPDPKGQTTNEITTRVNPLLGTTSRITKGARLPTPHAPRLTKKARLR